MIYINVWQQTEVAPNCSKGLTTFKHLMFYPRPTMFPFTLTTEIAVYLAGIKDARLHSLSGPHSILEACRDERCLFYLGKMVDKAGESGKVLKCRPLRFPALQDQVLQNGDFAAHLPVQPEAHSQFQSLCVVQI